MEKLQKINELTEEVKVLSDKLSAKKAEISQLKKLVWSDKYGINIGDKVSFVDGRETKIGILVDIDVRYSMGFPLVNLLKKDGSVGLRKQTAYNDIKLLTAENV